jgi:YVTN family beta-propeller protein
MRRLAFALLLAGCGSGPASTTTVPRGPMSSTIAITSDDKTLWVVNQDSDSVSSIDVATRTASELALGPAPSMDPVTMRYEPKLKPRALAILPGDKKVYVAAQVAGQVLVVDTAARAVTATIPVGAEPVGVVASPDGKAVFVVSHEAAVVTRIDPTSDTVVGTLPVGEHPWGASMSADGKRLYVSQFLLHPGVTVIDAASFTVSATLELAEQPPDTANGKLVPNGVARGVYAAVPQPSTGTLWLPHLLLAIKTPEPDLDFQSTVFPTISLALPDGSAEAGRVLFAPPTVPGVMGSFTDVVSGPRAIDFTPDGKLALVADAQSEDVLVLDGYGNERGLVRPVPSTFLEGIVVDHAGTHAYLEGRNSHDVTVLAIDAADDAAPVRVDGDPIDRIAQDPMPTQYRLGQRLFYSANSAQFALTKNFWVACSTCHLEGRTDAVTWLFQVGPRDTPSNAGGPVNTGFLLRQALRNRIADYDTTIDLEQGGSFHRTNLMQQPLLDELSAFVNYAVPFPQNPNLSADGSLTAAQQHGQQLFGAHCATCHAGAYLTDSGQGNPTLDPSGTILLHNIGTCNTGPFPDVPAPDEFDTATHQMHTACDFDTPTLRGIFSTAPYFHDGTAATLRDVLDRLPAAAGLSDGDKNDLVEYVKTL